MKRRLQGTTRPHGRYLLPSVDGRSTWARWMRATLSALVAHCGGDEIISDPLRMMARRVAVLEAELVFLEDCFARARADGKEPTPDRLDLYGRLADRQRRLAETLGWQRTPRNVTPDLRDYLKFKEVETVEDAEVIQ